MKNSVVGWRSYELRRKWRDQQKRSEKEKNRARGAAGNVVILSAGAESPVDPSKEYDQYVTIPYRHPPVPSACLSF